MSNYKLYLTGVRGIRSKDLEDSFGKFGKVVKISTGTQDFGFIDVETEEDADNCVKNLHRTRVGGQIINVEKADPNIGKLRGQRERRDPRDDSFVCYNCKKPGHLARDCSSRPRNPNFLDTRGTKKNDGSFRGRREHRGGSRSRSRSKSPRGGEHKRSLSPFRPTGDRLDDKRRPFSPERKPLRMDDRRDPVLRDPRDIRDDRDLRDIRREPRITRDNHLDALPPRDIRDDRDIVHRDIPRDRDIRVVRDPLVRDREPGRYPERDERRPLSPDAPYRDAYRAPRDRAYPPNDFYESHDRRGPVQDYRDPDPYRRAPVPVSRNFNDRRVLSPDRYSGSDRSRAPPVVGDRYGSRDPYYNDDRYLPPTDRDIRDRADPRDRYPERDDRRYPTTEVSRGGYEREFRFPPQERNERYERKRVRSPEPVTEKERARTPERYQPSPEKNVNREREEKRVKTDARSPVSPVRGRSPVRASPPPAVVRRTPESPQRSRSRSPDTDRFRSTRDRKRGTSPRNSP